MQVDLMNTNYISRKNDRPLVRIRYRYARSTEVA